MFGALSLFRVNQLNLLTTLDNALEVCVSVRKVQSNLLMVCQYLVMECP